VWKLLAFVGKWLRRAQLSSADRELPFGPYLSMAALALMLSWNWLWPMWGRDFFETARVLITGDF
jgi:leader peptidase (prepilin peptidase)/N-methyltransferase